MYAKCDVAHAARFSGACWLIVLNPDEAGEKVSDWAREIVGDDDPVFVLMPRGVGPTKWTTNLFSGLKYRAISLLLPQVVRHSNYVERSLALIGRTVDSGRVWDVRVAASTLDKAIRGKGEKDVAVKVLGRAQAGIIAAYAALFEPAISEVILVEPTETHMQGPHFLNVLRVLDIPDALGLLAPKKLTIYGARDSAFKKTVALYEVAGARHKLIMP